MRREVGKAVWICNTCEDGNPCFLSCVDFHDLTPQICPFGNDARAGWELCEAVSSCAKVTHMGCPDLDGYYQQGDEALEPWEKEEEYEVQYGSQHVETQPPDPPGIAFNSEVGKAHVLEE